MKHDAGTELESESSTSKETQRQTIPTERQITSDQDATFIFACSICDLKERYDYKGTRPPFARQLLYSEECYVMRDPFSLSNKSEVLILGADCSKCKRTVCSTCSIYYARRFCLECASSELRNLPLQLHSKITSLAKHQS